MFSGIFRVQPENANVGLVVVRAWEFWVEGRLGLGLEV